MNEHRQLVFGEDGGDVVYLCECADPGCLASVRLTRVEYARLRPGVILAPGHEAERSPLVEVPTEPAAT